MKTEYSLILLIVIILYGCSTERLKLLDKAEKVLPGNWQIESIRLPRYGLGITYQGNTFIADTILFDVGSIEISDFSTDTLSSQQNNHGKVSCTVSIGMENFPYSINHLFISGEEIFSRFEYNGPPGTDTIVTPGKQFIWSSFVFNNNYIINVIDNNKVELGKANDQDNHVITLRRL